VTVAPDLRALVAAVADPELPMLTIEDLGILRDVRWDGGRVEVDITPTYLGCPAMEAICAEIEALLRDQGVAEVQVRTVLAPAWTTEWMSEGGRRKLREAGIAPPQPREAARARDAPIPTGLARLPLRRVVACPRCGSRDTEEVSHFGATACKSLHRCRSCREPFEHFKSH
jgi:ring-1,2-phenylacetyl-CoA epoxidase subunit PaaD